MARPKKVVDESTPVEASTPQAKVDTSADLIKALVTAIELTRPKEKKTAANRKPLTPWTPKDGSPKLKLKRKHFQHGLLIDPDFMTNESIDLMNRLKPGVFLDGWVRVIRRKDRGIDIDYPIKTASQRLKLVNVHGIRNFDELLARCIEEAANPVKYAVPDED